MTSISTNIVCSWNSVYLYLLFIVLIISCVNKTLVGNLDKNTNYLSFKCTFLFCLVITSGGISCQRLKPTSILEFKPIKLDGNVVYMQKPTFSRTCKNPTVKSKRYSHAKLIWHLTISFHFNMTKKHYLWYRCL